MRAVMILVGFAVIQYSYSVEQDQLKLTDVLLDNEELGTGKVNQHQHPGRYETIAKKSENIARAMANAYILESQKKHEDYIAAYEKYNNHLKKYNELLTKRDNVKIFELNDWTKL